MIQVRHRFRCLGMVALATAPGSPLHATGCPVNEYSVMDSTSSTTDASRSLDLSHSCSGEFFHGSGAGQMRYDLRHGTASVAAQVSGECWANASIVTRDVFTVVGPPSETPLAFEARLDASGCAGGSASSAIVFTEGTANSSQAFFSNGCRPEPLALSIVRRPGETFDLSVRLGAGANVPSGSADVTVHLWFEGIPSTHAVVSCQGYVSDPRVSVRESSWGRLKVLYR
jgi:hypothetical protein